MEHFILTFFSWLVTLTGKSMTNIILEIRKSYQLFGYHIQALHRDNIDTLVFPQHLSQRRHACDQKKFTVCICSIFNSKCMFFFTTSKTLLVIIFNHKQTKGKLKFQRLASLNFEPCTNLYFLVFTFCRIKQFLGPHNITHFIFISMQSNKWPFY